MKEASDNPQLFLNNELMSPQLGYSWPNSFSDVSNNLNVCLTLILINFFMMMYITVRRNKMADKGRKKDLEPKEKARLDALSCIAKAYYFLFMTNSFTVFALGACYYDSVSLNIYRA